MSMGQRKKIPIGFEPITSQKPRVVQELMESKVIKQSSYVIRVLHTTRICTVEVIVVVISEIKMVNEM